MYTSSWIAPRSDVHSQQRFFFMGQVTLHYLTALPLFLFCAVSCCVISHSSLPNRFVMGHPHTHTHPPPHTHSCVQSNAHVLYSIRIQLVFHSNCTAFSPLQHPVCIITHTHTYTYIQHPHPHTLTRYISCTLRV